MWENVQINDKFTLTTPTRLNCALYKLNLLTYLLLSLVGVVGVNTRSSRDTVSNWLLCQAVSAVINK